ncbi:MAG: hypothetical protein ACI8WB_004380 [Phenylobacterium sp.]|jgi:hypothetical protein
MNQHYIRSIWLSYASAEQPLVDSWVTCLAKAASNQNPQYQLFAYLREFDSSEPGRVKPANEQSWQKYLVGGERVQLVIESIATALRRVIVLSPDYLKSDFCLWELSSCLIYSTNNPLIVLVNIDDFAELIKTTLPQQLARVYNEKMAQMHRCFQLSPEADPTEFFQQCLAKLGKNVYVKHTHESTSADELLKYAQGFSCEKVEARFWDFVEECFEQWLEEEATVALFESMDEDVRLSLTTLKQYEKRKILRFIKKAIQYYHKQPTPPMLNVLYQLASIMTLLRLDPGWVAEIRDANPHAQLLRLSVPGVYNYDARAIYEISLAAHAIALVPVELAPGDQELPKVGSLITITPPPESLSDTAAFNQARAKRKKALQDELVSRVMNKHGDKLSQFLDRPDWKVEFRATAIVEHSDDQEFLLTIARFYVNQRQFTQNTHCEAIEIIRELMLELNDGATPDRIVRIGVLQRLNKSDSLIVYGPNHDKLQVHINQLLGVTSDGK